MWQAEYTSVEKEKNEEGRRRVYDMGRKDATNRPTSQPTTTTPEYSNRHTIHPSDRPTDRPSGRVFYNVICIMGGRETSSTMKSRQKTTTQRRSRRSIIK
ncbi:hypothetical protein H105_06967 [Trichophyton soudanense CBS 452.61]|uniref:Uncharacterized protein n=1 Tax=Trichophyton soudanense CBS 452.61 TaxID=1215331 RepID=A0A022XJ81_TRISD|nr:hypothetical protein H105_06967 [Trichophyton soudanense CBS 452.61]